MLRKIVVTLMISNQVHCFHDDDDNDDDDDDDDDDIRGGRGRRNISRPNHNHDNDNDEDDDDDDNDDDDDYALCHSAACPHRHWREFLRCSEVAAVALFAGQDHLPGEA